MGRASHPRRAAHARIGRLGAHGLALPAAAASTTGRTTELADVSLQPSRADRSDGPVRRVHRDVPAAVRAVRHPSRPPRDRALQRDRASERRMGCAAGARGVSVRHCAEVPGLRPRLDLLDRRCSSGQEPRHQTDADGVPLSVAKRNGRALGGQAEAFVGAGLEP